MRRANRAVRPTCGSEYEAVPLETIAVEVGDERKVRKEGRRLACANRGASFRAACCAPRLHLPKIHHLRVSPSPPSSPAPFYLLLPSCAFPSTFSLRVTLLSHLSRHSTADKSLLTGDYSSPSREAERRYVLLHGGLRHCESVLGRISGFDEECDTTNLREFQVSRSFRCRASYS